MKVHMQNMKCARQKVFDQSIFENVIYSDFRYQNHKEVARELKDKNPYLVTVLIESLKWELRRRKEYTKQSRYERSTLYRELLFKKFFNEYGQDEGNEIYGKWLKKYQNNDEIIIKKELESRYNKGILKTHKNHEKLFKPCYGLDYDRYYHLPAPFDHIDWRNPFDNIIIWDGQEKKLAVRGGSGSSGQREINSVYLFGLSLLNQIKPIPSYLFIYDQENRLWFIKKFSSLTMPDFDLGSNYFLSSEEKKKTIRKARLFDWEILKQPIEEINFLK